MEGEAGTRYGNMTLGSDSAASGGQYVEAPENQTYPDYVFNADNRVDFQFNIAQSGNYRIKAVVRTGNGHSDSYFVRVDSQASSQYEWHMGDNHTTFDPINTGSQLFNLASGTRTISFYHREDGAQLDLIELEFVSSAQGPSGPSMAFSEELVPKNNSKSGGPVLVDSDPAFIGPLEAPNAQPQNNGYTVTVRKTYLLGNQPIAQANYNRTVTSAAAANSQRTSTSGRTGLERHHIYSDHLGSANTTLNMATGVIKNTRFYPFGEVRDIDNDNIPDLDALTETGRGFTGHRENRDIGLTYMNVRFYVPGAGRFASADTIVPSPANPQEFNRYSYVTNNPINIIDPSGHYGDSVHHDETLKIIKSVRKDLRDNLSLDMAQSYDRIADINVGTDYDPVTTPFLEGNWEATVNNMTPHWFTDPATGGRLHEAPTEYYHFRSRATYETRLQQAISSKNIKAFGIALHGYQDSFSHVESGYTFSTGSRGVAELYGRCLECFDSFGGATLNIIKAFLDFGHSGSSIIGINTDAFSLDNPRDERMVAGTTYWITMYILNDYGINADEYYMEQYDMTHDEWYQQNVAQD